MGSQSDAKDARPRIGASPQSIITSAVRDYEMDMFRNAPERLEKVLTKQPWDKQI